MIALMRADQTIGNKFIDSLAINKIKSEGMKCPEMSEKIDLVVQKGEDKAIKAILKEFATHGLIPNDTAEGIYEEIKSSITDQSKTVADLINYEELSKPDRVKTIASSDSIELKVTQNMKVLLQELIAKIECDDIKKAFLALGSSSLFLDTLNKADPDFKKKLESMSQGMYMAGMDEMEICKEIGQDIQVPDIAN